MKSSTCFNPSGPYPMEVEVEGVKYQFTDKDVLHHRHQNVFLAKSSIGKEIVVKWARSFCEHEQEVKALRILGHHEAIVCMLGEDPSRSLLFFEKGDISLHDKLRREKIPLAIRREMARQVGEALTLLHSRALLHNDLNAYNVILFGHRVKLADFGNSRPHSEEFRIDYRDYTKMVYNILVEETRSELIPDDFEARLQSLKDELGPNYIKWVQIFANLKKHIAPKSLEEIMSLL